MAHTVTAPSKQGLVGKDFITIAIFGVLLFFVFMVFAAVFGMSAQTFWYSYSVAALVGGIVWVYIACKVPKRGALLATSLVAAVVALALGMLWTGPAGIVVGGALAELIAGVGEKRTAPRVMAAFAVWTFCFWFGTESMLFLAGDAYVQMVVQSGMSEEYGRALVDFMRSPMIVVSGVLTLVGPLVGAWFGEKLFKKHFAKIAA